MQDFSVTTCTYRDTPIVDYRDVAPMLHTSFQKLLRYAIVHYTGKLLIAIFPSVRLIGVIVSLIAMIGYCRILFTLRSVNEDYRTAGICHVISCVLDVFSILTLLSGILALYAAYREFSCHSLLLSQLDIETDMDTRWMRLWVGLLISELGFSVCGSLTNWAPLVFTIPFIVFIVVNLVVHIQYLIYLFRTKEVFSEYLVKNEIG